MKERGRNEEKKGKSLGRNEGEAREEGGGIGICACVPI